MVFNRSVFSEIEKMLKKLDYLSLTPAKEEIPLMKTVMKIIVSNLEYNAYINK